MLINAIRSIATGMPQIDIQCMAIIHVLGSANGGMADSLWIAAHLVKDNMGRKRGRRRFAGSTIHVEISDIA